MPTLQDGEVAKRYVAAVFQCDGFVADSCLLCQEVGVARCNLTGCAAARKALCHESGPGRVWKSFRDAFSNDERIMPVVVAVVLKRFPLSVWFRRVIDTSVDTRCFRQILGESAARISAALEKGTRRRCYAGE